MQAMCQVKTIAYQYYSVHLLLANLNLNKDNKL